MRGSTRVRVAFVGKGGSGKSTIAGTFARLLARRDEPVLALDSDPLPGMPYSLGIAVDDAPIPDEVVVEGPTGGPRWVIRPGLDAAAVIDRYGVRTRDGAVYLQFGNLRGHVSSLQRAQHAWSQVVHDVDASWHLVGDLPGGTRQPMFGWARYASTVCIVVEPTAKSMSVARRLLNLADAEWGPEELLLVASKVRDDHDVDRIEQRLERAVVVPILDDIEVRDADALGIAPLDAPETERFVDAVGALLDRVSDRGYGRPQEVAP